MSKETIKRDKNGRFAKKGLPADGGMNQEEYIKHLELERDAFKITAEKVSSMYLNKCAEWSKERTALMDAIRLAYMHIGWFRSKLSFFTKMKNRDKIIDMEMEMDRLLSEAEGLDRE